MDLISFCSGTAPLRRDSTLPTILGSPTNSMGPGGAGIAGPVTAANMAEQGLLPLGSAPANASAIEADKVATSMTKRTRSVSLATGVSEMIKEASNESSTIKPAFGNSRPYTLADISSKEGNALDII